MYLPQKPEQYTAFATASCDYGTQTDLLSVHHVQNVSVVFRDPEVQAVEVLTQAKKRVVEPGWARLAVFSGQALVDSLDSGLYDSAKADAASPQALSQVRELARPGLAALVAGFLRRNGVKAEVLVRFRSEAAGGAGR